MKKQQFVTLMSWSFLLLLSLVIFLQSPNARAEIRPFVKGSYSKILKKAKGKPTIITFWSVTCRPCLAEMFHWEKVTKESPDLNLVMVSIDDISTKEKIIEILNGFGLDKRDSWAFADQFTERIRYDVDKKWRGELPLTYFISPNGDTKKVVGMVQPEMQISWQQSL